MINTLSPWGLGSLRQHRVAAALTGGGYDTDAQTYITAVNSARSSESASALTTTAEEILDDMVRLLKGGTAANGQLTGLTAVNCWANIQHLVMFRGAGNVGTGTKVGAIVGSDGTLVNGHPWDARGDAVNDRIQFNNCPAADDSTFIWGGLIHTTTNYNGGIFSYSDVGDAVNDLGLASWGAAGVARLLKYDATDAAIAQRTFSTSGAIGAALVFDNGVATLEDIGVGDTADTYTPGWSKNGALLCFNVNTNNGGVHSAEENSRPHFFLHVSSVLDATDRANVHAILQAAYDALAAIPTYHLNWVGSDGDIFDETNTTGGGTIEYVGNVLRVTIPSGLAIPTNSGIIFSAPGNILTTRGPVYSLRLRWRRTAGTAHTFQIGYTNPTGGNWGNVGEYINSSNVSDWSTISVDEVSTTLSWMDRFSIKVGTGFTTTEETVFEFDLAQIWYDE